MTAVGGGTMPVGIRATDELTVQRLQLDLDGLQRSEDSACVSLDDSSDADDDHRKAPMTFQGVLGCEGIMHGYGNGILASSRQIPQLATIGRYEEFMEPGSGGKTHL